MKRDSSYHQGTVWPWLIGHYLDAAVATGAEPAQIELWLSGFTHHLADAGLGSISEIFDGDPPHLPRGAFAQAWSVSEVLRVWMRAADANAG